MMMQLFSIAVKSFYAQMVLLFSLTDSSSLPVFLQMQLKQWLLIWHESHIITCHTSSFGLFADGEFGAYMQVHIQNDGPVTIELISPSGPTDPKQVPTSRTACLHTRLS